MKRFAAFAGIIGVLIAAFVVLGNSKRVEGPAQSGGSVVGSAGGEAKKKPSQAVPVVAVSVVRRDIRQILEASGSLRTDNDIEIGSRIEGRVREVRVKEGDRVRRGFAMVFLDDREARAQLARSRAARASAQARLSLAGNQGSFKDQTAKAELERARAALSTAKSRLQQAETNIKLVDTQTRIAVETAQSGVRVATERLSIARDLTRKQELRQAQISVEQSQTRLLQAQVETSNARQVLERRRQLFRQDAVAREEVDDADRRFQSMQAQERVAESEVSAAKEKLELAREGSRPEEVRIAEGQLAAAQRNLVMAQSDEQKRDVARDDVAAARNAVAQAEAVVRTAEVGLVQDKITLDEVSAARSALVQAEADVQFYEAQLADYIIRAPVDGVVSSRAVGPGEMVTRSSRLLNLVALNETFLEVQVPELDAGSLRPGQKAEVAIDSLVGKKLSGSVTEIIPVADRTSRSFRARIAVRAPGLTLPPGGFGRALVDVGLRRSVLAVRKDAVLSESGDKYVWLIAAEEGGGQVARRQLIRVGLVDDQYAEVLSGLSAGSQVVAAGSPTIVEGTALTTAAPPSP